MAQGAGGSGASFISRSVEGLRPSLFEAVAALEGIDISTIASQDIARFLSANPLGFLHERRKKIYENLLQQIISGEVKLSEPHAGTTPTTSTAVTFKKRTEAASTPLLSGGIDPENTRLTTRYKDRIPFISRRTSTAVTEVLAGIRTNVIDSGSAAVVGVSTASASVARAAPTTPTAAPVPPVMTAAAPTAFTPTVRTTALSPLNLFAIVAALFVGACYGGMTFNILDLIKNLIGALVVSIVCGVCSGLANAALIHDGLGKFGDVPRAIKKWVPKYFDPGTRSYYLHMMGIVMLSLISARTIVAPGGALIAQTFLNGARDLVGISHPELLANAGFMIFLKCLAYALLPITGVFILKTLAMFFLSRLPGVWERVFGRDSFRHERINTLVEAMIAVVVMYLYTFGILKNADAAVENFLRPLHFSGSAGLQHEIDYQCIVMVSALARLSNVCYGLRVIFETGRMSPRGFAIGLASILSAAGGAMQGVGAGTLLWLVIAQFLASWLTNLPLMRAYAGLKATFVDTDVRYKDCEHLQRLFTHLARQFKIRATEAAARPEGAGAGHAASAARTVITAEINPPESIFFNKLAHFFEILLARLKAFDAEERAKPNCVLAFYQYLRGQSGYQSVPSSSPAAFAAAIAGDGGGSTSVFPTPAANGAAAHGSHVGLFVSTRL